MSKLYCKTISDRTKKFKTCGGHKSIVSDILWNFDGKQDFDGFIQVGVTHHDDKVIATVYLCDKDSNIIDDTIWTVRKE